MSNTCTLANSCQIIIDGKDKEIKEKDEKIEELEAEVEEYERQEKYMKIFLIVQAGLLMVAFQIWDI